MKKIKKHKKKILVGILIVVLLACLGFGGYKYYEHYEDTKFENKNWLNRHISLEKIQKEFTKFKPMKISTYLA